LFIVDKNIIDNTITVSPNKFKILKINKIEISEISFVNLDNFINSLKDTRSIEIDFQTRYRQKPQKGKLKIEADKNYFLEADFIEMPAIGQSIVFYNNEECIGGGIINKLK
jgi:tRNA-uridine 2-sulfurtransferase